MSVLRSLLFLGCVSLLSAVACDSNDGVGTTEAATGGANTVIEGAYVGPSTSIGPNCVIRRAEIEFSMVMDGCRILDVGTRIGESILGYEAQVLHADRKPRSHRLTIGDRSIVEIA